MTNINLYCPTCHKTTKSPLLDQVACRGVLETACRPVLCHGYMLRHDGVVQELVGGEWVVTNSGSGHGVDRSRYQYEGPNGTPRSKKDYSPHEKLRFALSDVLPKTGRHSLDSDDSRSVVRDADLRRSWDVTQLKKEKS